MSHTICNQVLMEGSLSFYIKLHAANRLMFNPLKEEENKKEEARGLIVEFPRGSQCFEILIILFKGTLTCSFSIFPFCCKRTVELP